MFIVKHRRWFFLLSALLVLGSVVALFKFGLNWGTDFTGGTIMEVTYSSTDARPDVPILREAVGRLGLGDVSIQPIGEAGLLLRLRDISTAEKEKLNMALAPNKKSDTMEEKRFSSVGPALGQELARKGIWAMVIVVILILIYIAFVFRKVSAASGGVSSWVYGLIAIVLMIHDALIPTGIFVLFGVYRGAEVDALFLTAFLTILGLSVNDKIVTLDRVRENLRRRISPDFTETVGQSLTETLTRSFNTSVTVILVLLAIFFFGGDSTKYFALVMALGMIIATYSSIFIAPSLLVSWQGRANR